jgi:hypothetical protein
VGQSREARLSVLCRQMKLAGAIVNEALESPV